MCVIRCIHRLKDEFGRLRANLSVAQRIIHTSNPAKVNGQVSSGANDAPVIVAGHQDLPSAEVRPGQSEAISVAVVKEYTLFLAESSGQRHECYREHPSTHLFVSIRDNEASPSHQMHQSVQDTSEAKRFY